ncbi:MAG: hypothetical protein ACK5M7_03785 [Draconibacterium sp.]
MKIRLNISKNLLIKLVFFAALVGIAFCVDAYQEKNPTKPDHIHTGAENHTTNQGEVYVLAQANPLSVKTFVQKVPERNQYGEAQNKLLRKYYSVRNYQVLKAEVVQQTTPLISSYHYLVFQNHSLSPDEDPLS